MNFEKKTRALSYGMEFTHGIRRALMGALALVYFVYLGFSIVSITTLFAISTLIMIFFEFPTGAIADYDSRKKSLVISFFLLSVAFFGIFAFNNFWLIAVSWILGDIAWTFSTGAGSAWIIDALGYSKNKSKLVNLISRCYFFEKGGHIIGGLIGLVIVAISFRFVWLVISITNLIMMFIIIFYVEERNFKPTKVPHNYAVKAMIKAKESFSYLIHKDNSELRALLIAGLISIIGGSIFFIGVPLLFTEIFNLKPENLSALFAFVMALSLISPFIAEKISNKKGFRYSLFGMFAVMGLAMIVLAVLGNLTYAIIAFGIIQISLTATDVISDSALEHEFSSKIRASLGSLNSINWSIAHSIGVFLAGISITFLGIINTIVAAGGITIVAAIIYLVGMKKEV
ncbi:MAG: MFS transporter [archaeon]